MSLGKVGIKQTKSGKKSRTKFNRSMDYNGGMSGGIFFQVVALVTVVMTMSSCTSAYGVSIHSIPGFSSEIDITGQNEESEHQQQQQQHQEEQLRQLLMLHRLLVRPRESLDQLDDDGYRSDSPWLRESRKRGPGNCINSCLVGGMSFVRCKSMCH